MWVVKGGAISRSVAVRACRDGHAEEEVGMLSRGRLHGGRPHARWRRRTRGMGSEPTKTSAVRVDIHLTTSHEGRASEARTVGGARGRCTAAPGICARRVDAPRLFVSLWE